MKKGKKKQAQKNNATCYTGKLQILKTKNSSMFYALLHTEDQTPDY